MDIKTFHDSVAQVARLSRAIENTEYDVAQVARDVAGMDPAIGFAISALAVGGAPAAHAAYRMVERVCTRAHYVAREAETALRFGIGSEEELTELFAVARRLEKEAYDGMQEISALLDRELATAADAACIGVPNTRDAWLSARAKFAAAIAADQWLRADHFAYSAGLAFDEAFDRVYGHGAAFCRGSNAPWASLRPEDVALVPATPRPRTRKEGPWARWHAEQADRGPIIS